MTVKGAAWAAFAAHNLPDGMEPNLEATATYDPPNFSWPGGRPRGGRRGRHRDG